MRIGYEVHDRGWRQRSLISARALLAALIAPSTDTHTTPSDTGGPLHPDDYAVVTSNDCDIAADPDHEPFVEVMCAYWTTDKTEIHNARRNSIRRFLLQRRKGSDGQNEGLVADATGKLLIAKALLLGLTPEDSFAPGDAITRRRFPQWLGARYNRPAVEDRIVKAVHRPIVEAISKLSENDRYFQILNQIDSIRYRLRNETPPFEVELLLMRAEGVPFAIDERDAYALAGWLDEKIRAGGQARVVHWDIRDIWSIAFGDIIQTVELPLTH